MQLFHDINYKMYAMKKIALFSLLAFMTQVVFSQESNDTFRLTLEFPILDLPYQGRASKTTGNFLRAFGNPSMRQSHAMSNNLYAVGHWAIEKHIKTKREFTTILFKYSAALALDVLATSTPFGSTWLHEEYHRAILTKNGVNSFNDVNTFPFGQTTISVNRVEDQELIDLYNNERTDFIRLMVAGNEGQSQQVRTLQRNNFFYNQDLPHIPFYWMTTMSNIFYVNSSADESFNDLVDEVNLAEGNDVEARDFTGPDFTAWADALFSPEKAYEDRGIHPSGVGIDRYVKPADLSDEALAYLKKQGNLQWLNLISPHMIGFPSIKLKTGANGSHYGNFALRHLLTSFGNAIMLDLLYKSPRHNIFLSFHNYNNLEGRFGGLELGLINKQISESNFYLSGNTVLWSQPENQEFRTSSGQLGGLLAIKTSYRKNIWNPYVEVEAKSSGWTVANPYLDQNFNFIVGLSFLIP